MDRQLRIPRWNQGILARARLGVVGDEGYLTSLFLLAAAALGINHLRVLAPALDERFISLARDLNPEWHLHRFQGYCTHPFCYEVFSQCHLVVDLSRYSLAHKILLEQAFQGNLPVLRALSWQTEVEQGFKIFTYRKGREWLELQEILSPHNLPVMVGSPDGVLDIIAAGIILEETKNILLEGRSSPELICYRTPRSALPEKQPAIAVVGAGALGNFVGLGLALAGFRDITFIDPDLIDVTNLNRQVFFGRAVGASKSETLAAQLNRLFQTRAAARREFFQEGTDCAGFEVIFDCVDNFASRIVLSETCASLGKILISGGTDVAGGQVVTYRPGDNRPTPAAVLGLYNIEAQRAAAQLPQDKAACIYQPDPAVIMSNKIIAGLMVDACRKVLSGYEAPPLFYDSRTDHKISLSD